MHTLLKNLFILILVAGVFLPLHSSLAAASTWTGATSADWNTAGNWSGGIPISSTDVTIPDAATTPNDPNIVAGAVCNNLTIAANGILNGNAQAIMVYGSWTNVGTFNHGSGTVKFGGNVRVTLTPGASSLYNLELDKSFGYNDLTISGTVTVLGNITHTNGEFSGGQINLAGNYIIAAGADGTPEDMTPTTINLNDVAAGQTITCVAGGAGAAVRVDKAGGILTVLSDITLNGWTYVQGTVAGLDTYKIVFGDNSNGNFVPGALTYGNIQLNKTGGHNRLTLSGTATLTGNFTQTAGVIGNGQINLTSGNYVVAATSGGGPDDQTPTMVNFNGTGDQTIVYSVGGMAAGVRIDKASGTFTLSDNVVFSSWAYIRGTIVGLDTHALILGDDCNGAFTPGAFVYGNIEIRKSAFHNYLFMSGTATVTGNLTHTAGKLANGQINVSGNYIIGAGAAGAPDDQASTVINLNGTVDQAIAYSAGGIGASTRVDKANGTLTVSDDLTLNGWTYIRGAVVGVDTHTLTFGDDTWGSFTPGALAYGSIAVNKSNHFGNRDDLSVAAGTLNMSGNLTITEGHLHLESNNPTVNVSGSVSIGASGVLYAGSNPLTISGNWTNAGTFTFGNGSLIFAGTNDATFTPGGSTYKNIELNKTGSTNNDNLTVSGTATVSGNFTQTNGSLMSGQINLAGNYIVGALSEGAPSWGNATVMNFNSAGAQTIVYTPGGIAAHVRIDKASGTFTLSDNVIFNSWSYVQGTVAGLDTHPLILGDNFDGYFTPGTFIYNNIELNKTGAVNDSTLNVSGIATVSGNFTHTRGTIKDGQINLAGSYIIGAGAAGAPVWGYATVVNFNHASNNQAIVYNTGGVGGSIRVDKSGGNLTISDDITVSSWTYVRGDIMGLGTHTLIFGDNFDGFFTPGTFIYNNVELNNTGAFNDSHLTLSAGTLNISGNLTLTDGQFILSTNNPAINLGGNLTINPAVTYTKGTGILTFSGTDPSTLTDLSVTPQNLGIVALNKTNTTETQNKLTLASSLTCNTLSIDGTSGQADTLDLGNGGYTLTLSNVGNTANVFTVNGTVTPGDSTIKYTATNSAGNINLASTSYDNLELSGAETYALSGTTTLTGNLSVGATSILSPGTSTVNLTGTNQSLSGNTTFYNLTKDITTSDTLTFAANSTTTINPSGTLTLKGQDRDNRLSLVSSTPDTQWNLAVNDASTYDFDFLNVQDSDATTRHLSVLNSLDAGNNTNWTIVNNTATGITTPSINTAGSIVTIRTTASDTDHDNISLKIKYSIDNGSTWHDPYLSNVTSTSDTPTLNNANEYQIAGITTASDNTVTILWDTKSEQNELSSILYEDDIKIKITPYDGTDIGSPQTSSPFEVNNRSAVFVSSSKPDLSDTQITSDNDILYFINLPNNITLVAISTNPDFQDIAYQDITEAIDISNFNSDTIYLKFRTSQGSTSDIITYNKVSHSTSSDLKEGDIVKTKDNFDVYIIKYKNGKQYKRLILSPSVFNSYQHLKWRNIKIISQAEMDRYVTSNLVKETIDATIFELFPNGDTGERRKLDISKPYDIDSVYEINRVDRDSYVLVK